MRFIVEREGLLGLFKGIGPQITKGLLVQGLLMMTKERYVLSTEPLFTCLEFLLTSSRMELAFILLFASLRKIKEEKLQKTIDSAAEKAKTNLPTTLK